MKRRFVALMVPMLTSSLLLLGCRGSHAGSDPQRADPCAESAEGATDPDGAPERGDETESTDPSEHGDESAADPRWRDLLAEGLESWGVTQFGGVGECRFEEDGLHLEFGSPLTGIHWVGEPLPTSDYELEVTASREVGTDFFAGITFPVGDDHLTLILGGWAGSTVGLSCLDGFDASENETTQWLRFDMNRPYTARIRVSEDAVTVWLDGESIIEVPRGAHRFELRTEVFPCRPLGIAAYNTVSWVRSIRWRSLGN